MPKYTQKTDKRGRKYYLNSKGKRVSKKEVQAFKQSKQYRDYITKLSVFAKNRVRKGSGRFVTKLEEKVVRQTLKETQNITDISEINKLTKGFSDFDWKIIYHSRHGSRPFSVRSLDGSLTALLTSTDKEFVFNGKKISAGELSLSLKRSIEKGNKEAQKKNEKYYDSIFFFSQMNTGEIEFTGLIQHITEGGIIDETL